MRLTIDYYELNKVTSRLAPVVAKYHEIMVAITSGVQWFSMLDLSNTFFSILLSPSRWYKLAFTFSDA